MLSITGVALCWPSSEARACLGVAMAISCAEVWEAPYIIPWHFGLYAVGAVNPGAVYMQQKKVQPCETWKWQCQGPTSTDELFDKSLLAGSVSHGSWKREHRQEGMVHHGKRRSQFAVMYFMKLFCSLRCVGLLFCKCVADSSH